MSQGSEAAEQMTKETLRISETIAKLSGTGAKNLAVFLAAVMKDVNVNEYLSHVLANF